MSAQRRSIGVPCSSCGYWSSTQGRIRRQAVRVLLLRPSSVTSQVFRDLARSPRFPISRRSSWLLTRPSMDETIVALGSGAIQRAKAALREWTQFDLGWVELYPRHASTEVGSVVAVLIHHFGFWSLNVCRVVYGIGNDAAHGFGYAYGTLSNHGGCGEELFKVVMKPGTSEVSYIIRAASRPRAALARLGYPLARHPSAVTA